MIKSLSRGTKCIDDTIGGGDLLSGIVDEQATSKDTFGIKILLDVS